MARLGFQTGDSVSRTAPRIRAFTRRRGVVGDARRADAQHHRERRNGRLAGHRSADGKRVAATIRVATPSSNVNWQVGSSHSIYWTHNLGSTLLNRFDIAVSYDSGHTWAGIANRVNNGYNFYSWVVTGAVTDRARVRVRWTDGTASAEDISDVDFRRGWVRSAGGQRNHRKFRHRDARLCHKSGARPRHRERANAGVRQRHERCAVHDPARADHSAVEAMLNAEC
jgi:hypothetical protein